MKYKSLIAAIGLMVALPIGVRAMQKAQLTPFERNVEPVKAHLGLVNTQPFATLNTNLPMAPRVWKTVKPSLATAQKVVRVAPERINMQYSYKLDSIITTGNQGEYVAKQVFTFSNNGKELTRNIYTFNNETQLWDIVENYIFVWNEDGLVVEETALGYGGGMRNTYEYNDRGLGIGQTTYMLVDNQWEPSSRGEYEYDELGNMVEERLYVWQNKEWLPSVYNIATWDVKKRQTSIESYYWENDQWVGASRYDYVWYDGPNPEYVEGTDPNRMTMRRSYTWNGNGWTCDLISENGFNIDGYCIMQNTKVWNGKNFGGTGDAYNPGNLSWESHFTLDEHHNHIYTKTYWCVDDSAKWVLAGVAPSPWTYDEEGNGIGRDTIINYTFNDQWEVIGSVIPQVYHEGENAAGQKTWVMQYLADNNGIQQPLFEDKYRYDEDGHQTYVASWDWVDGVRTPSLETTYKYDALGNVVEVLGRITKKDDGEQGGGITPMGMPKHQPGYEQGDDEGWQNSSRWLYAYSGNTRTQMMGYRWQNGDWTPFSGQIAGYDFSCPASNAFLPNGWQDPYKIDFIHDLVGNASTNDWLITTRTYYYTDLLAQSIDAVESTNGNALKYDGRNVYTSDGSSAAITLLSLDGSMIKTVTASALSLQGMHPGIYIAVAKNNDILSKLKIIVR